MHSCDKNVVTASGRLCATFSIGAIVVVVAVELRASGRADTPLETSANARESTLDLQLSTADILTDDSRAALIREATAIWRRAGIELRWHRGEIRTADAPRLPVLVLPATQVLDDHVWGVGTLRRDQNGAPIVVTSIAAGEKILSSAGFAGEPLTVRRHRLGLVLGRAVAHEIGHYLLGTSRHATGGLMRAKIDSRDFADLRDGDFFLDRAATIRIRGAAPAEQFADHRQR